MKVIAICYENNDIRRAIYEDLKSCFTKRCCKVSFLICSNANDLQRYVERRQIPDIVIYERFGDKEHFHKAASVLSGCRKKFGSIAITNDNPGSSKIEYTPTYEIPFSSINNLWSWVCKIYDYISSDDFHFVYYKRPQYVSASLSDILYFTSEGRRIHLVSSPSCDNEESFYDKLDDVEEQLLKKKCQFIRIHKSYLVNTQYIASFDKNYLKLITGEYLKISNYNYYKKLSHTLNSRL